MKALDTFKKSLIKINIESSPQEIWIRIRFLEEKKTRIPITGYTYINSTNLL